MPPVERKKQYDKLWGRNWTSEALAGHIDAYVQKFNKDQDFREDFVTREKTREAIAEKIFHEASKRGIRNEILNHIGIYFTGLGDINLNEKNTYHGNDPILMRIRSIVEEEFGTEMAKRLHFSYRVSEIRNFSRKRRGRIPKR